MEQENIFKQWSEFRLRVLMHLMLTNETKYEQLIFNLLLMNTMC